MRKIFTTLALALLATGAANAQAVLGYGLEESAGVYTPLSEPTTVFDGSTSDNLESWTLLRSIITPDGLQTTEGTTPGFELGFETELAGQKYNKFVIAPAGYFVLGQDEVTYDYFMGNNFLVYGDGFTTTGLSSPDGTEFYAETKIGYQKLGEGDDERMVLQFTHWGISTGYGSEPIPVDFQVAIYKSGKITVTLNGFGGFEAAEDPASLKIGVRQGDDYVCASGDNGSLYASYNSDQETAKFNGATADGTTLTWTVPADCVTPAAQPTDIILESSTTDIVGSFSKAADADLYLVAYTTGDAQPGTPVDGTVYTEGDTLGDATVLQYGPDTEFQLFHAEGGTDYTFYVYSVGAYGLNGPKFNTVNPLTMTVATLPSAPGEMTFDSTSIDSITLTAASNEAGDDVVVVYTPWCGHDFYSDDHGLFGTIPADVKAGDVLEVPADYEPYYQGAPMPENGGVVAYVGKASQITVGDLKPATGYYFGVFTRNAEGKYTSVPAYAGTSTWLENPYSGDSYNFPRYLLPLGWTGSETTDNSYSFRTEEFLDRSTGEASRGTQIIQLRANVNRGDAINGKEVWLVTPMIDVNDRHVTATFSYNITEGANRFTTNPYNEWAEDDVLQILVSTDKGENWTALATYDAANHPQEEEVTSYVDIKADLNEYRGQTVMLKFYWKTYMAPAFGGNLYIDRFSLAQAEFPAVPEVTVGDVTESSAVITWVSQQEDYEVAYRVAGTENWETLLVTGAQTCTLKDLEVLTAYEVKVRGVVAAATDDADATYTEWSDPVEFTTTDYPAVDAPENLVSDLESYAEKGIVVLTWDPIEEAEKYEVAYRLGSSTQWTYVETVDAQAILSELEDSQSYIWKVRAFCTHDRETSYSAQASFTTTVYTSVNGVAGAEAVVAAADGCVTVSGGEGQTVALYAANGTCVAFKAAAADVEKFEVAAGCYIVKVSDKAVKLIVR